MQPVIELLVANHPGVMARITNLFSRRAFNLEGILCGPIGDGRESRIFLQVTEDDRLPRVLKELNGLHDVLGVMLRYDVPAGVFDPRRVGEMKMAS